jgi:hypothetical protein
VTYLRYHSTWFLQVEDFPLFCQKISACLWGSPMSPRVWIYTKLPNCPPKPSITTCLDHALGPFWLIMTTNQTALPKQPRDPPLFSFNNQMSNKQKQEDKLKQSIYIYSSKKPMLVWVLERSDDSIATCKIIYAYQLKWLCDMWNVAWLSPT